MFAKPGHHLLPPERIDEWRRHGVDAVLPLRATARSGRSTSRSTRTAALRSLRSLFIQPTLIFQGLHDTSVDHRTVERSRATRPNVTLSLLDDDHQLMASLPRIWEMSRRSWGWWHETCRLLPAARSAHLRPRPCALRPLAPAASAAPLSPRSDPGWRRCAAAHMRSARPPLETYVARVLAGEAAPESAPAALEALAIAIRTYTVANREAPVRRLRPLRPDALPGDAAATWHTERRRRPRPGRSSFDGTTPATVYYSASCGGRTEMPSEVWPGAADPPYLPSRTTTAAAARRRGAPSCRADLQRALLPPASAGRCAISASPSRNESGRVAAGARRHDAAQISGQDLRAAVGRTLGWQHIHSATFELRRTERCTDSAAAEPDTASACA